MHLINPRYPPGWGYGNECYHKKRKQFGVIVDADERGLYAKLYNKATGLISQEIYGPFNPTQLINDSTK